MTASRRPFILADRTLVSGSTLEHLRIAADLGYDAVSVRVTPSLDGRAYFAPGSTKLTEAKRALVDYGVAVWDAESIRISSDFSPADLLPAFEAAGELGARYFVTVADDADDARVTDHVAALAEAARPFGIRIAMEFMVYIGVNSWQRVLRILEAANSEATLLVDALHLARSGALPHELKAVDPGRLAYFQLCDAPQRSPDTSMALRDEARLHRLLPGEGELPLIELIRAMPKNAAVAVEVPSLAFSEKLGDREFAARALAAARTLVDQAE